MEFNKKEIISKKFSGSMRGYDKAEVEVYLEWIGSEADKLINENQELKKKLDQIGSDYDKFAKEKEEFGKEQQKAKQEIERIKKETNKYCDQLKLDTKMKAKDVLKDSYVQLKDLKKDIDSLQKIKNSFVRRYQTYLKDQLESIKAFQKEKVITDDK
ncbi:MAG: DivIVA domain-containing protein [Candidatus Delongbacteria bacterium]